MRCPSRFVRTQNSVAQGWGPCFTRTIAAGLRRRTLLLLILTWLPGAGAALAANPPVFLQSPRSGAAVQGADHVFRATAAGDAPLTYQWHFRGLPLPGQTTSNLHLARVGPTDAGGYHLAITNLAGAVTSRVATLTVRTPDEPGYPPPQGGWITFYSGDGVETFDPQALDGDWNHDNTTDSWSRDGRGPGQGLPGGLSSTNGILTFEDAVSSFAGGTEDNRRFYFLRNLAHDLGLARAGTILQEGFTLTFRARLTPPTDPLLELAGVPRGFVNNTDGKGMFTVHQGRAPNNVTLSFSLNQAVEDLTATTTFNFGQAGLHMNNLNGNAPGTAVDPGEGGQLNLLPLNPDVFHEFWITLAPNGATAGTHRVSIYLDGARVPATFDVTAGVGVDFAGAATDPVLTNYVAFGLPSTPQRAALDVDFFGYAPGVLVPSGFADPVGFSTLPADHRDLLLGQTATFTCSVTGTPPWSVQWFRAAAPIPGATNLTYTTPPLTPADQGAQFTVIVTNAFSAATSSPPAILTLLAPPTITAQPQSLTVTNGDPATFRVTTESGAPSYQWRFNTADIPDATNSSYTIPSANPAHAGDYTVVVSNSGGAVSSAVATLTVPTFDFGDAPPPYPTRLAEDGPRHRLVPGVHLGATVDYELDGQSDPTATGDDLTAGDEDGVRFLGPLLAGQPATVEVVAAAAGYLDAWLDFNADGSWADPGDHIFASQPLTAGTNLLNLTVPASATPGTTFARFRYSTGGGLLVTGSASDGEVEDYSLTLVSTADLALAALAAPDPVAVGSNLTLTLTVANAGPSSAPAVILTTPLPTAATYITATVSQGSCSPSGGIVTCVLGTLPAGATATVILTISPANVGTASTTATVSSIATDLNLANNSVLIAATVLAPPTLTAAPQDLTVTNGHPVTLTVSVNGAEPLQYQWRFQGSDLPGQTSPTLTIAAATPADAGPYTVHIRNSVGAITSPPATLTVLVPPAISVQPQDRTNTAGSTATFIVTATGTAPLTYQWYRDTTTPVPGATNPTLTLPAVETTGAALFHVLITNRAGAVASAPARLTVIEYDFGDAPDPAYPTLLARDGARHRLVPGLHLGATVDWEPDGLPTVSAQGDDLTAAADEDGVTFGAPLLAGQTVPVQIIASAPGFLSAWLDYNRNGTWADPGELIFANQALVAGTNVLLLTVPSDAAAGPSFARFRFNSTGGLAFHGEALDGEVEDYAVALGAAVDLGVTSGTPLPAVATGSEVTYTLGVTNRGPSEATGVSLAGPRPAGVQYISAVASQGSCSLEADTFTCAFGTLPANGAAALTLVLRPNTAGPLLLRATATSAETELAPADNASTLATLVLDPPVITLQPLSQSVTNDDTLRLVAVVSGTDVTLQWLRNGAVLPGANQATLALPNVQPVHAGEYTLWASNLVGTALSTPASVQVLVRVALTVAPQSLVTTQGATVQFHVDAVGTPPLSYIWYFEGQAIEGALSDTLTLTGVQAAQAGTYVVQVANEFSAQTSAPAMLTVLVPPQILASPQSGTVFAGAEATLSVAAQGTDLNFQWFHHGTTAVPDATQAVLRLPNAQQNQSGPYTVRLRNLVGSVTSAPATLTIREADFGDAPDPYPTRLDFNAAYHWLVPGFHLGTTVDFEPDGHASPDAQGDDTAGAPDEDGVTFLTPLRVGQPATVQVLASAAGRLDAWMDWDANGSWYDLAEQIFAGQPLVPGANELAFVVPPHAVPGPAFGRFRFSTAGGLLSEGPAPDGEVEDYRVVLVPAADLALGPVLAPARVSLGSTYECHWGVTHHGPSAVADVRLTHTHSTATRIISVATTHGDCLVAGARVECALGTLAPGEQAQVVLTLEAIQTARLTHHASVSASAFDPNVGNNAATLHTTVFALTPEFSNPAPIEIPAAALAAQAGPAAPYPSRIHVTGVTAAVHHVTVTLRSLIHTYPSDMDVLLVGPGGQAVVLMSDAGSGGADAVTVTFDDAGPSRLPASGRLNSLSYYPTNYDGLDPDAFPTPAPAPPYATRLATFAGTDPNGPWSLYILDDTAGDDGQLAGGWSLAFGTLEPLADLALVAETAPNPSAPGNNVTSVLRVTNQGPAPATGVVLASPLPVGATFVSATASQGTCTHEAGTVRCDLGTLPVGAAATVQVVLTPLTVGDLLVPATVSARELDLNPANNTVMARAAVTWPVDLAVQGSGTPTPAIVGTPFTFTLRVTNHEPHDATAVRLTATWPPEVELLSVTPTQGTCSVADGVVTCALGDLPAAASAQVQINYAPRRPGWLTNTASVTATGIELNPANNAATLVLPAVNGSGPFPSSGPVTLADQGPAAPYPSTVLVSGLTGAVYRITATLSNLSHPAPEDLDILLVSPGGQGVMLMSDAGAGQAVHDLTLTFDDAALIGLPETGPLGSGAFRPTDYDPASDPLPAPAPPAPYTGTLADGVGTDPNGHWSLFVFDDRATLGGTLGGWSLNLETLEPIADLSVTVTDFPALVATGSNFTCTLRVTNHGPADASAVILSNSLPPGLAFVSATPSQGACTNTAGTLRCALGQLRRDAHATVALVVSPVVTGWQTQAVSVAAAELDLRLANNSASSAVLVEEPPVITVPPASQTVTLGAGATFAVEATGTPPLFFQWEQDGVDLSGATNATLVLPGTTPAQRGLYRVRVSNRVGGTVSPAATLRVLSPPIIAGLWDQTVAEDGTTTPIPFFVDDEETPPDALSLSVHSTRPALVPPGNVVLSGTGQQRTVQVTPAPNQSGSAFIVITVTDGDGLSASEAFELRVLEVNDLPTVAPVPDLTLPEDGEATVSVGVGDVETPATSLWLDATSSNPLLLPDARLTLGGSGSQRTVTLRPLPNQFGSAVVTLTVGDAQGAEVSTAFTLTVVPVNDPPTLSALPDQTVPEDTATDWIPFTVGDVETPAGALALTGASSHPALVPVENIYFSGSGAVRAVRVAPAPNGFGTAVITVTVNDGGTSNHLASRTFTVEVRPVNDLPVIAGLSDRSVNEDTPLTVNFTVGDVETAAGNLVLSVGSGRPSLVPTNQMILGGSGANRTLSLRPATNEFGSAWITVSVQDGDGAVASESFLLTVAAVNDPPVLAGLTNQTMNASSVLAVEFGVADADTPLQQVTVSALSSDVSKVAPGGLVVSGTGAARMLTITPVPRAHGTVTISLTANDGGSSNAVATGSFVLTILSINDPPEISAIRDQSTPEDTARVIAFTVGDSDDAADTLIISGVSSNLALVPAGNLVFGGNGSNRTVMVRPTTNQSGTAVLRVTATDSEGASASTVFTLTVDAVNDAPTISTVADQVISEDTATAALAFTVGDVETAANKLTVTAHSSNPVLVPDGGLALVGTDALRTVRITPATHQSGTAMITLTVRDQGGLAATSTFVVTVSGTNDAPTISNVPNAAMLGNTVLALPVAVGDVETPAGSLMLVAASSNPALIPGSSIVLGGSGANRSVTLTPLFNQIGTATITLTVTDADGASAQDTFVLTVNPAQYPPVIAGQPQSQTVSNGQTAAFSVVASGSPPLGYQWFLNGSPVAGAAAAVLSLNNVQPAQAGVYTVRVTNLHGTTRSAEARLSVIAAPQSPVISPLADRSTNEDQPLTVPFTVQDADTPAHLLTVTAASTNTTLLPVTNIVVSGAGTNRTALLIPATNQFGQTRVTLTVSDGVRSASNSFLFTVSAENDVPTLNPIADTAYKTGSGDKNVAVTGISSGAPNESQTLTLSAVSSDVSLVTIRDFSYTSPQTNGTVKLKFANGPTGVATVTVTIRDGGASNNAVSRSFQVGVFGSANAVPTLSAIPSQVTLEDTPTGAIPFTVADTGTPAGLLTVSGRSSNPMLVPDGNIAFGGSGGSRTVTVAPASNQFGTAIITVSLQDTNLGLNATNFSLTVLPVNDAPTISTLADQVITENTALGPLALTLADLDHSANQLTVTASSSDPTLMPNANLILGGSGTERALTLLPAPHRSGSATITLRVSDGQATNATSFALTVAAFNHPPILSDVPDQNTPGGTPTRAIPFTVGDSETPAAGLSVSASAANPGLVPANGFEFGGLGSNRTLRISPAPGQTGATIVTLTVTDAGGASVSDPFLLTVTAANVAPTLNALPNLTLPEDAGPQSFALSGISSGTNTESQSLTVTATSSHPGLTGQPTVAHVNPASTGSLQFTPVPTSNGVAVITVTVNDGQAQNAVFARSFTVTIVGAPRFSPIADVAVFEDTPAVVAFTVSDPETPPAQLTLRAYSSNINLLPEASIVLGGSGTNRTATLTPRANEFGFAAVTLTATDGSGLTRSNSFVLVVHPVNDPPTIAQPHNLMVLEDAGLQTVALSGLSAGPGNEVQPIWITARSSDPALIPHPQVFYTSPATTGTLRFTPAAEASGSAVLTLTVTDGQSEHYSTETSFTVTVVPVNDPPQVSGLADVTMDEDTTAGPIPFTVGDIESPADSLIVTARSSVPSLVPDANLIVGGRGSNRSLTISPATNQFGAAIITVTATDPGSNSVSTTFLLTVRSVNDLPTLAPVPDQVSNVNETLADVELLLDDVETSPSALLLSAHSSNPALARDEDILIFGSGARRILFADPVPNQSGSTLITLTLTDGHGASVTQSFTWTVQSVNQPPVISPIADQQTLEDTPVGPLTFTVVDTETAAADLLVTAESSNPLLVPPEGLVLGGSGNQRSLTVVPATNQWAWDPVVITLRVTDGGGASAESQFALTVVFVNDPPWVEPIADQTILEDAPLGPIGFEAWDPDLHGIVVTVRSSNPALLPEAALSLTAGFGNRYFLAGQPAMNQSGSATLTVAATDVFGITVEQTFGVTVLPVNDAPTLDALPNLSLERDAGLQTLNLTGLSSGAANEAQALSVSAVSSDPALIPHPTVSYANPASTGTLSFQPQAGASGRATVTVTVRDDGGTLNGGQDESVRTFTVAVGQSSEGRLEIARGEGEVRVMFETLAGGIYTVEYKDSLEATVWNVLATRTGTGTTVTVTDSTVGRSQRFYRLLTALP